MFLLFFLVAFSLLSVFHVKSGHRISTRKFTTYVLPVFVAMLDESIVEARLVYKRHVVVMSTLVTTYVRSCVWVVAP